MTSQDHHRYCRLEINLSALQHNFLHYQANTTETESITPVVKANAYGLGVQAIAPALIKAGARQLFVAYPHEALELREILRRELPEKKVELISFAGFFGENAKLYVKEDITPVLNSLSELKTWKRFLSSSTQRRALLHLDSGMARLGLDCDEQQRLVENPDLLSGARISHYMTHFANADQPGHPSVAAQKNRFERVVQSLPAAKTSLANSAAFGLGPGYRGSFCRIGYGLYGEEILQGQAGAFYQGLQQVVELKAQVLQTRRIDAGESVGYGWSYQAKGTRFIATVGLGYADGFHRLYSDRTSLWFRGTALPVVGRVSMDAVTVDITDVVRGENAPVNAGTWLDVLAPKAGLTTLARDGGTIGYEVLTSLGQRYHRVYRD